MFEVCGPLTLTKGAGHCEASLLRKTKIEKRVRREIGLRVPGCISEVVRRYGKRYGETLAPEWPKHYGVDVLGGNGPMVTGANIFAFFPSAANVQSNDARHQFGFEFLNVWQQAFERIVFPALRLVLDRESQGDAQVLLQQGVADSAYMASVLHELGHRVGPFRVSPAKNPKMILSDLLFDACGELTTDALGIALVPELPASAAFVTLYRLFFLPRKGYIGSGGANISTDGDALLAPLLWKIARTRGAIVPLKDRRYHFEFAAFREVFRQALDEVDALGQELLAAEPDNQQTIASRWMRGHVDYNLDKGYTVSEELAEVFDRLRHLPEESFEPPVSVS